MTTTADSRTALPRPGQRAPAPQRVGSFPAPTMTEHPPTAPASARPEATLAAATCAPPRPAGARPPGPAPRHRATAGPPRAWRRPGSGPWAWLLALGLLLWTGLTPAATPITVQVEPDPVVVDESFRLIFSAEGKVDDDPDFAPLERDFQILGSTRSSNLSYVDGKMQRSSVWVLSVMAKRSGTLEVPPIAFGSDRSAAATVRVEEVDTAARANAPPLLLLEAQAEPGRVYVQQQVLLKVRLLRRVQLGDGSLSKPSTGGTDAVVELLGKDRSYDLERDGVRWSVIERSFAVFPQQSGTLRIDPVVFEGQVVEGTSSYNDPFGSRIVTRRLESQPVTIEVAPVPADATGRPWLPSRRLQLHEVWSDDPPEFEVGKPLTRTLAVLADGLMGSQLPELAPPLPDGLKQYPEAPVLDDLTGEEGIIGQRQEKMVVVATRAGRYTLPPVEIPWWNTQTNQLEVARLPAREVEVRPAPAGTPAPGQAAPAVSPAPGTPAQPPGTAASQTAPPVAPVAPAASPAEGAAALPQAEGWAGWPWLAAALGLGWLATGAAWWRSRPRPGSAPGPARPGRFRTDRLRAACRSGEATAAKEALLTWAGETWPDRVPASLGELARRLPEPLAEAVRTLNQALYRPGEAWREGEQLWQAFQAQPALTGTAPARPSLLQPLQPR